jgi:hypothetical protein
VVGEVTGIVAHGTALAPPRYGLYVGGDESVVMFDLTFKELGRIHAAERRRDSV